MKRLSFCLAFGSAASILFSIAISQILLALSLAALLTSGAKLCFPPLRLPLAVFIVITTAAALASGDFAAALPQFRKFYVFAIVLVICSTFDHLRQVRHLVIAWSGIALLSAVFGFVQFAHRRQEGNNYAHLLDGRITGLAGHWMTFGGEEMIVLLMLASYVLFSERPAKLAGLPVIGGLIVAITLGMTRCIFLLGVPAGLSYLVWRRRKILVFVTTALALGLASAPLVIRERAISAFQPHGDLDSNAHRAVCRIVGLQMVKAHPWLGLGPEQVGRQFNRYVPPSVARPLPRGWYGHLHNIYVQYAAERGIPGLLSMLWLIGRALTDFARSLQGRRLDAEARAALHGAIAVILAVLAEGLFEYNLGDSEVLTMFLSVIACGYVAIRQDEGDRRTAGSEREDHEPVCVSG